MSSWPKTRRSKDPIGYVRHNNQGRVVEIPVYRHGWFDTKKNLAFAEKRKELGERATAELGVQCWG